MVEVKPGKELSPDDQLVGSTPIGQVVLKRLITAEQAIEYINNTGIASSP